MKTQDDVTSLRTAGASLPWWDVKRRLSRLIVGLMFSSWISCFADVPACRGRDADDRPNILFIMSDDHAYQAISAYGSTRNKTPHIDRIAHQGIRFDRCLVTNSICGPSRACILTGQYSHRNGVYDNYQEFDGSQMTYPKLLRDAGYQTAVIGKWHLSSDPTGFDYWDVLPGQGKYYRPDFLSPRGKRQEPGYATDVITRNSLAWLREHRDPQRPFLLIMQHKAPHRPWDPSAKYVSLHEGETIAEPDTLFDDYQGRGAAAKRAEMRIDQLRPSPDLKLWKDDDPHRVWLYEHMTPAEKDAWEATYDQRAADYLASPPPTGREQTKQFYQMYLKDYLRCIASVDESVGQVLDYLDKFGLAENTIVVYTSDQGFYLGEHGWFDKRFVYEQSLKTPLLIRWPKCIQPGRAEAKIVSNLDFAETFLDAAGVEVPAAMQGRSLLPMLKGDPLDAWRESFYYHYYEGVERDHNVHKHYAVVTDRYKLIHFYTIDQWELFDLDRDPNEMQSVYGQPDYAEVQAKLLDELKRLRTELEVPDK